MLVAASRRVRRRLSSGSFMPRRFAFSVLEMLGTCGSNLLRDLVQPPRVDQPLRTSTSRERVGLFLPHGASAEPISPVDLRPRVRMLVMKGFGTARANQEVLSRKSPELSSPPTVRCLRSSAMALAPAQGLADRTPRACRPCSAITLPLPWAPIRPSQSMGNSVPVGISGDSEE